MSGAKRYREIIDRHGLSGLQRQALSWVPDGARVLELGCAAGSIGELLMQLKGCRVTGAEIDPDAAAEARGRGLEVHVGSLDDAAFRESIRGPFDVVMATDVLEHLTEPQDTLAQIRRWLAPDGRAIVAVPNVATWSMRASLLRGDFTYQDHGILDRTHLRFFTYETFHELIRSHGWEVEDSFVDSWEVPGTQTWLWDYPQAWMKARSDARARDPEARQGLADKAVQRAFGVIVSNHQRAGRQLGRLFPNLCAKHIGLLIRP